MTPPEVLTSCPAAALAAEGDRWVHEGVVVVRHQGVLHAFADTCPHAGASLADAEVTRGAVTCPHHHARFRLRDGAPVAGPCRTALACYDVDLAGGSVAITRRTAAPKASSWWGRLLRSR